MGPIKKETKTLAEILLKPHSKEIKKYIYIYFASITINLKKKKNKIIATFC